MKYADIKGRKTGTRRTITVILDGEAMARIDTLRDRIRNEERVDRRENRDPVAPMLKRQLDEMYEEARQSEVTFTFRSAGRAKFDKLIADHPATDAQRKQVKDMLSEQGRPYDPPKWNSDTFPAAIVAISSVDPVMSVAEAQEMWDDENWSPAELLRIFECALSCYWEVGEIPFAASDTELTRSSESSWTTAPNEAFLDLSS